MATLRQLCRPGLRAVGNRLRFPHSRMGSDCYLSRGSRVTPDSSLGRGCRIFAAEIGADTHLHDSVVVGHQACIVSSIIGARCQIEGDAALHHCVLANDVAIQPRCVLNQTTIGRYSYVARETFLAEVNIGAFASIGPRSLLGCGNHPTDLISTAPVFYSNRRQCGVAFASTRPLDERQLITIGHDVWLGAHVFVCDGVTIGDGAIVAAGAVVTQNVAPYAIVGGVPAKLLRYRFTADAIARLLALQWWRWDESRLRAAQAWFAQADVGVFLQRAEAHP